MYIFIGFSILFGTVARDLFLDEVYVIGSRFSYISSDENAKAYWIQLLLNVLFCLCLIGYGTYNLKTDISIDIPREAGTRLACGSLVAWNRYMLRLGKIKSDIDGD